MLSQLELEIMDGWERDGIITNLTLEDLAIFARGDKVAFCGCADGKKDVCCHKRRLRKKLIVGDTEQENLSQEFLQRAASHQQDPNRWYAGAAAFAKSYRGFNLENATFKRDQELAIGMVIREWEDLENIFHWRCGMLLYYKHVMTDILRMAEEAREFLYEGKTPPKRIHSYFHIQKVCPTCEDIKQRIFRLNI